MPGTRPGMTVTMNIAERKQATAPADAQRWLDSFGTALKAQDAAAAVELFLPDGLWRDVLAFTWTIQTMAGRPAIEATLRETLASTQAKNFHIPQKRTPPRWVTRAGTEAIEALFEFETMSGPGNGVLRLVPDTQDRLRAWTLNTNLHELRGHEEEFRRRAEPDSTRDFGAENWSDRLAKVRTYTDRDPTVIVVGGGQAGLSIAARLHQLGIDALIVDRHERVGDNWRKRYHSLTLHNEVHVNHLPYLPFPPTFPVYIPKDKLANWFESYVEAMELNFWTGTELVAGSYDDKRRTWHVTLRQADGTECTMQPRHLIFATGVSSIPYTPALPGLDAFAGTKVHSGDFKDAKKWKGRKALVLGTGTSGHDVAQELQAHGAEVTMIQRSKTYVVSLKEAQSVYAIYSEGIPFEDCDLLGHVVSLSGSATLLSVIDCQRTSGGQGAARRTREARLPPAFWRGRNRFSDDVFAPRRRLLLQCRLFGSDHLGCNRRAAIFGLRHLCSRRGSAAERACHAGRAAAPRDRLQKPARNSTRLPGRRDR